MNLVKANVACNTCQFWEVSPQYEDCGCCRRYPPSTATIANSYDLYNNKQCSKIISVWRETESVDWCGEHKFDYKKLAK
jgi:hypothetical protein